MKWNKKISLLRLGVSILGKFGYKIYSKHEFLTPYSELYLTKIFSKKDKLLIFDVGAHRGETVSRLIKLFPNSKVLCFEPFPDSFQHLKSFEAENIVLHNFGFSDNSGTEEFFVNHGSATNSLLRSSENAEHTWGNPEVLNQKSKINCEFTTMDAFISENNISSIDFLKIDVQGAEHKVLAGAIETLSQKIPKLIQLEIILGDTYEGQKSMGYYTNFLEKYGYSITMISDMAFINNKLVQIDLFASC